VALEGHQPEQFGPGVAVTAAKIPMAYLAYPSWWGTPWSVQPDGSLDALSVSDGQLRATVSVGAVSRFATPAASGPALFIPTIDGIPR
jgi:hypothetical protein